MCDLSSGHPLLVEDDDGCTAQHRQTAMAASIRREQRGRRRGRGSGSSCCCSGDRLPVSCTEATALVTLAALVQAVMESDWHVAVSALSLWHARACTVARTNTSARERVSFALHIACGARWGTPLLTLSEWCDRFAVCSILSASLQTAQQQQRVSAYCMSHTMHTTRVHVAAWC